jgi:hypothetical protein
VDDLVVACIEPHVPDSAIEEDQVAVPEIGLGLRASLLIWLAL